MHEMSFVIVVLKIEPRGTLGAQGIILKYFPRAPSVPRGL